MHAFGPKWRAFIADRLGTNKWVVVKSGRLTERLRAQGYTLAITPRRYTALQQEFQQTQRSN